MVFGCCYYGCKRDRSRLKTLDGFLRKTSTGRKKSRQRKSLIKVLHSDRSDCIFVDVPETDLDLCKSVTRGALDLVQAYSEAAETCLGNDLHSRRQSQGLVFFDSGVTAAFQIKWSMGTPCRPSFDTIASFGRKMVVC